MAADIDFRPRSRVTELIASPDNRSVAGVRFEDTRGTPGSLAADLVVDASGRASSTLRFLEAIGSFPRRIPTGPSPSLEKPVAGRADARFAGYTHQFVAFGCQTHRHVNGQKGYPPNITLRNEEIPMNLEFVFDYRSPYAYLANTQIRTPGVQVDYKPIDILAVMKKVNNHPTPLCPPKARYARIDAQRWAKHCGVAFSPNGALLQAMGDGQLDGMLLLCEALAARELGAFQQVNDALFEAVWAGVDDLVTEEGRAAFLKTRNIVAIYGGSQPTRRWSRF